MTEHRSANADQAEFWSTQAGHKWVAHQSAMDQQMQPLLDRILTRADLHPGQKVLDIGSGTGVSTIAAAEKVGASGLALGADISTSMLGHARKRADGLDNVEFVHVINQCVVRPILPHQMRAHGLLECL